MGTAAVLSCILTASICQWSFLARLRDGATHTDRVLNALPEGIIRIDGLRRLVLVNAAAGKMLPELQSLQLRQELMSLAGRELPFFLDQASEAPRTMIVAGVAQRVFEIQVFSLRTTPGGDGWLLSIRDATIPYAEYAYTLDQERLAAIGQLVPGIAHDINNIMTAIVLQGQMALKETNLPPVAADHITTIVERGQRASQLTEKMLDFTLQSATRLEPVSLRLLMVDVQEALMRMLPENIQLEMVFNADRHVLQGDSSRLQQMFLNLALNARDAMSGGGKLSLTFATVDNPGVGPAAGGRWVSIRVADSGAGIPAEALPYVFEPFYTTKPAGQRAGLGLSQVHSIVQQHGGRIDVESQAGSGTAFCIHLPLLEDRTIGEAWPGRGSDLPRGHGETILLAEDDPASRWATREILEGLNYTVLPAADGQTAITLFEGHHETIELVLSDVVMPHMGGVSLLHALRQAKTGVRIVLMSGYPLDQEGRRLLGAGQVTWVQKPLSAERLARVVAEALAQQPPPDDIDHPPPPPP